jgi:hypothetical protein
LKYCNLFIKHSKNMCFWGLFLALFYCISAS